MVRIGVFLILAMIAIGGYFGWSHWAAKQTAATNTTKASIPSGYIKIENHPSTATATAIIEDIPPPIELRQPTDITQPTKPILIFQSQKFGDKTVGHATFSHSNGH